MNHDFSVYDPNDQGPAKFGPRRLYKGGGQSSSTSPEVAQEFKPLLNLYTQQATNVANTPFKAYGDQRYADLNGTQNQAIDMIQQRATNGSALTDAGSQYLQDQIQSSPTSATQNPYGQISAGTNQYAGSNPYLQQNIDAAMGDVTRAYKNTVMPAQTNAVVGSGSFGNSGLAQAQSEQERQLADQLGKVSSGMRMQDYTTQQQLAESGLNRDLGAQQFNASQGNDWASRNDAMLNNYRSQNLSALGLAPTYANQSYNDASQLLNAGNLQQNQNQNNLDFAYQQFQDAQNDPYKKLQTMGGVVGQNMGSKTVQTGGGK